MKIAIPALVSLALLSVAFPPASAFTCDDAPAYDIAGTLYLDVRHVADDVSLYSVWVYAESNGIPGLQRGGSEAVFEATGEQSTATTLGETDPDCTSATPDTLVL